MSRVHTEDEVGGRRRRVVGILIAGAAASVVTLVPPSVSPVGADGCNMGPNAHIFTGLFANGDWSHANNWNPGIVPSTGDICIPAGVTANVPTGVTLMGSTNNATLKNFGTLRIGDANAHVVTNDNYVAGDTIDNFGRVEVTNGGILDIPPSASLAFTNHPGAVVAVNQGGLVNLNRLFVNQGTVDITGGSMLMSGGTFDSSTGTQVGGTIKAVAGTVVFAGGTGAASFLATGAVIQGTIGVNQSFDLACDTVSGGVTASGNIVNNGLFRFRPRLAGSACEESFGFMSGGTFTNNGTFEVGDATHPGATFRSTNGDFVNGPAGRVIVSDPWINYSSTVMDNGTTTINASGTYTKINGTYTLNGTMANNGSFAMGDGSSFGYTSSFTLGTGTTSGNPVTMQQNYIDIVGSGPASFIVPRGTAPTLRNPNGPVVIHPGQNLTVLGSLETGNGGNNATAVENQGTITLTGSNGSGAELGTRNGDQLFTNKGTVVLDGGVAGDSGTNELRQRFVNAPGATVAATAGPRACQLDGITNNGLLELFRGCGDTGVSAFGATSVLRVHSSAMALADINNMATGSTIGGVLDVVTDSTAPLGTTRDVFSPAPNSAITGQFSAVTGSISSTLGYAAVYPAGGNGKAQVQVVAGSFGTGGGASAPITAIVPARLLDTRDGSSTTDGVGVGGGVRALGSTTEVQVTGRSGVPADASAAILNVTVTEALGAGYVTVWPCGADRPNASNLNFVTGLTVPNGVISKIGAGGKVCLYVSNATSLLVDVAGFFAATSPYVPLLPARLLDTRGDGTTVDGRGQAAGVQGLGSTTEVQVVGRAGVPANAAAAVLNVTVTEAQSAGYVTVWPCGSDRPNASNLNFVTGSTVPNNVISKIGVGGKVCLYVSQATHLLADVAGYFAPGSAYAPIVPARLLDTRPDGTTSDGVDQNGGVAALNSITEIQVTGRAGVPAAATAAVLNVTVTQAQGAGYVTVFPCGSTPPNASSLNFVEGSTVPNGVIAKIGDSGKVCLFASNGTHLLADVAGYFGS